MAKNEQGIDQYRRYCPGEERIRISDAVCLGRRRTNFPKCKGCPFNEDAEQPAQTASYPMLDRTAAEADEARRQSVETIFRADHICATVPDPLDADVAWRIGLAAAQFLRSELRGYDRSQPAKSAVVVGADMRKSSPELTAALIEGLRNGGSPVIDIGMVDTGQLFFAVNHFACCGGIHVTAGHQPARYNGFKITGAKGRAVHAETGLGKICKIAKNTIRHASAQIATLRTEDLTEKYKRFVRKFLGAPAADINEEAPLKLVVDASNGMAGRWFPILFDDVEWLEIVRLNFEHNGQFLHDPDPLNDHNLRQLADRVIRSKADLGICFDGDADRCVFVDNKGKPVRPDMIAALVACRLLDDATGATVLHDLRCSRIVPEEIKKAGGVPKRERQAFLKKTALDTKALFAAEHKGRYYFQDNAYCESAMIAFVQVLSVLTESGTPLNELVAPLQRYAHSGERNFQADEKEDVFARLADKFGDAAIDYLDGITVQYDDWWFNLRPSNDEPVMRLNMEAASDALLQARLADVEPLIGTPVNPDDK